MKFFPIALRLKNKLVIVIGGGAVAERKIKDLINVEACIKVIAPSVTKRIEKLAAVKNITWVKRCVKANDICKAILVIVATNDCKVNKSTSKWALERGVLVNVVDNVTLSSYISPALLKIKKVLVAVYTDGSNPLLSRDLKNYLKGKWNDFLSYRN